MAEPPTRPAGSPRRPRTELFPGTGRATVRAEVALTSLSCATFEAAIDWAVDLYLTSPLVEILTSPHALEEFFKLSEHWSVVVNRQFLTPWAIEIEHGPFVQIPPMCRKLAAALCARDDRAFLTWVEIGFGRHSKTLPNVYIAHSITVDEAWLSAEDYSTALKSYTPAPAPAEALRPAE